MKNLNIEITKNNSGFTLVEVLISIGLMAAASLALMKMNGDNMKSFKTLESRAEAASIIGEIRGVLSTPAACTTSFSTKKADTSGALTQIKGAGGNVKFNLVRKMGNIKIKSMWMSDSDPAVTVNSNSIGDTFLNIKFDRGAGTNGRDITKQIRLWVDVDAAKKIITCRSFTSGTSNVIERSTTNVNDVFYNDGNFGIGTNDPMTKLYVDGTTTLNGSTAINGDTIINGNTTINGDTIINGNTTINGDIKIGNSGATCDSSNKGRQKYDSISNKIKFCNGASWMTLGSSGGGSCSWLPPSNIWNGGSQICPAGKYLAGLKGPHYHADTNILMFYCCSL